MLFNTRKLLLSFVLSLILMPMVGFASSEFKGTETVNINKANAATLAAYLKGIGPSKADAIVKFRRANGNFRNISDITNVPGVGEETYKDIKSRISTTRGKSTPPSGYKLGQTRSTSKKPKSLRRSTSSTSTKRKSTRKTRDLSSASSKRSSTKKPKLKLKTRSSQSNTTSSRSTTKKKRKVRKPRSSSSSIRTNSSKSKKKKKVKAFN